MKKIFLALVAVCMTVSANAFEFDGIDLNANYFEIARSISAKGYIYDDVKDCLTGNCRGTQITLQLKAEKSKLGQLIVDVPMKEANAIDVIKNTFNVLYHVANEPNVYNVDKDGTTLTVTAISGGVRLTYTTPYYNSGK